MRFAKQSHCDLGEHGFPLYAYFLIAVLSAYFGAQASAQSSGTFASVSDMTVPRNLPAAVLLPNGKVLIIGASTIQGSLSSAELYDPATHNFLPTGNMAFARGAGQTATLLLDGRILVSGGSFFPKIPAEIYDPQTGTFSVAAMPLAARVFGCIATLLPNGNIFFLGGQLRLDQDPAAEIYDIETQTFRATSSSPIFPRNGAAVAMLKTGRLLITGGEIFSSGVFGTTATAELYDPAADNFSLTSSMARPRFVPTASPLADGRVLIVGGGSGLNLVSEIYDPLTGKFQDTGAISVFRQTHTATVLPNGNVLIAGGGANAEVYDVATGIFSPSIPMITSRISHAAVLLNDGTVLITGGLDLTNNFLSRAELFIPAPTVPVVLVHGYCSDPSSFGQMSDLLKQSGIQMAEAFDYNALTAVPSFDHTGVTIEQLADIFAGHVLKILKTNNARQIDVVAHSMGGLIVRAWMAGLANTPYTGEIRKLITISTPHYGAEAANLDLLIQALSTTPLFRCSATQADEMRFGSDFIISLHGQWNSFENSPQGIPASDMFFIAGTADTGEALLNGECGISLHGCTDDVVDISSAVLPSVSKDRIRYVPYKHASSKFLFPFTGKSVALVDNPQHKTLQVVQSFLLTGEPVPQCCGTGTVDYLPPHLRGNDKNTGLLLLHFVNSQDKTSIRRGALDLSFLPLLLPIIDYDATRNKPAGTFTGVGIQGKNYDINVSMSSFQKIFLEGVQINTGYPTVIDPVLLKPKGPQ